jgi:hypothetical protein
MACLPLAAACVAPMWLHVRCLLTRRWHCLQRDCDSAAAFCQRKLDDIRDKIDTIGAEISNKQKVLDAVQQVFMAKVKAAQQQEALQQSSAQQAAVGASDPS